MPAKKRQRRASRYAELARERGRRTTLPAPPPQRPQVERAQAQLAPRTRPSLQTAAVVDQQLVTAELRRIGLIGGLMLLLLFGLSRLLG
jgi:hypothetical protein